LLVYSLLNEHESQYGLLIPRGEYPAIRERGIDWFRETISGIEPTLDTSVSAHLESFEQCSLLSVESGLAERWANNGFLLIDDAAHVASPIGAEGNTLAIQHAVTVQQTLTP